ncbi:MAG: HAMP domain-containing sensor histidine kinase [Lachnospiraceae bacterium]|nr:HAMP domain-containing sensor histidine kinase [Lachnospiraceae bacterium]
MKLKTRLLVSFLMIIFVPLTLGIVTLVGVSMLKLAEIEARFGIDLSHLTPEDKSSAVGFILVLIIILSITAVILSSWIYNTISAPILRLSKATRSIRDGNLDFTLKPEGSPEMRELCEDFEEMRKRLKQANEESARYDQQNRELISNISHDLKTPITAIKGYVEGIQDGVADTPEKMEKYIRTISNKANEMDHLINELAFYSKIDTNRIPYNFNRVSVREFFNDAADELRLELEQKNIRFTYNCQVAEGVEVIADAEQIRRVINNIVSNSVKYMDKSEKCISLTITDEDTDIQVALEDNGKGIAAKDLGHIFDRFYRTDSSRHSTQGGSGIGLSIVRKIVEDHGGRAWASSREGEGTVMYFVLRKYEENV